MSQPYTIGKLARRRSDGSRYWHWCIKWVGPDGPHRVSLGTTDRHAADVAARKFWQQRTTARGDTTGEVVAAYLASGEAKDEYNKRCRWNGMAGFWAGLTLNDIDKHTPTAYALWRCRSTNTIRNELSLIKAAYKWALVEKIVDKVPVIVLPPMPRSTVSHLTKAQFRLFLDHCIMPHVRLYSILAVTTGARKGALLEAKWSQVDWDRCLLDLQGDREEARNKGRATVPLNDRAMDALREAKEGAISEYIIEVGGKRIFDVKKGVGLTAKRAGLHVHPHMFRHSAAVWMAEDRVPMSEIAAFLGHSSTAVTEKVYAKYHPDYLRQASKSLDW